MILLLLSAATLAIGVNIATSGVHGILQWSGWKLTALGLAVAVLSICAILAIAFGTRKISRRVEAIVLYRPATKSLVPIEGYELSDDLARTVRAVIVEHQGFAKVWTDDPLSKGAFIQSDPPEEELTNRLKSERPEAVRAAVSKVDGDLGKQEPRSFSLLREALEYTVLRELSLHLSAYFESGDREYDLAREMSRSEMPDVLLENRVLSLLSSPLEDRVPFADMKSNDDEEVYAVFGSDGAMYSRLDLWLPTGSRVSRPAKHTLAIHSDRLDLTIRIGVRGTRTNLPSGFEALYLDGEFEDFVPFEATIDLEARITGLSLLRRRGWEYYEWIDSFVERIVAFGSFDDFLEKIEWPAIAAFCHVMSRRVVKVSATKRRPRKRDASRVVDERENT